MAEDNRERRALLLEQARQLLASDPAAALSAAEQCTQTVVEDDGEEEVLAWRLCGQAQRALGQHVDAVLSFEHAARVARALGNRLLASQVRLGQIDSLAMLGRTSAATALAEELIRDFDELGADIDSAKALCNLGSIYLRGDQYAEARDCYARADAVFARAENPVMRAVAQVNQAIALSYLNQVEQAIDLYNAASATYTAQELSFEAAVVDTNLGFLHHLSGRHAVALASLNRAHDIFTTLKRSHEAARGDLDRGDAFRALNLFPEAQECYERALSVSTGLGLEYDCARAELGHATVLHQQGHAEAAAEGLERAEQIFRRHRNATQLAHVRLIRATLLEASGRHEEAARLAEASARSFARRKLHGWAAEARFLLAARELTTSNSASAARRMTLVSTVAQRENRGWLECRAERALGGYHTKAGRTDSALHHLRRAVAAVESARVQIAPEEMHIAFMGNKEAVYEDLIVLLLARGTDADIAEALEAIERSRSRLLLERVAASSERQPLPETLNARLAELRGELSRFYRRDQVGFPEPEDQRRFAPSLPGPIDTEHRQELERAYAAALREAELETGAPGVLAQPAVQLGVLQSALKPEETLISYYVANGSLTAFVVKHDSLTAIRNIADRSEVEQTARRLRYHLRKIQMGRSSALPKPLQAALHTEINGVLERLYALLLRPLEAVLTGERLIIVPCGELHGLPFHAFYDSRNNGSGDRIYAMERWEFGYAPSASVWYSVRRRAQRRDSRNDNALLVGVPAPGIERVASEVEQLRQILPGARILIGNDASVPAVMAAMQEVQIVHIATHAHFRQDNPQFSGLQFADGWLLARDLYSLSLGCELVTLSACETGISGLQAGEELFGLVRGFLSAGAEAVVGSFWPADDAATADLMTEFYTARKTGISDGAALRCAQRSIRVSYPHPYYWAAFGLIGHSKGTRYG